MIKNGFFIMEAQLLQPLLDIGVSPTEIIDALEEYNTKNFRSKIQALRNLSLLPVLFEMYTKEAIDEATKSTNLCDFPKLLSELTKGIHSF